MAYAFARPGDSPRDRLERIQRLARSTPHSTEGPIAVATTAIEARDWDAARSALQPLLETPTYAAGLHAHGAHRRRGDNDAGRVREWLARAVNAPRDQAWTADGIVSDHWAAISPVTGALDAFQWKVPVESADKTDQDLLAAKLEEFVALGARPETDIEVTPLSANPEPVEATVIVPPKEKPVPADRGASEKPVKASVEVAKPTPVQPSPNLESSTTTSPATNAAAFASTKAGASAMTRVPPRGTAETPRMFVPPRAPDDPGLDESEDRPALGYQTAAAKRPL